MNWEAFYLICFGIGLCLTVVVFFTGSMHLHIGSFDIGGHHGTCAHDPGFLSHVNGFSLMAFLCWFGGTGYLLTHFRGYVVPVVLVIATLTGLCGAAVVSFFLVKVLLPHERVMQPEDTEMRGVIARVSSTIHANGTGEIIFTLDGGRRGAAARTEDGSPIARNTHVLVLRYERGIAWVRPWNDLDDLEAPHTPT